MLKEYLNSSPLAERVELEGNVILNRRKMTARELSEIENEGRFSLPSGSDDEVELEINGLSIATGRIVKKRGEYYFKILKMDRGDDL